VCVDRQVERGSVRGKEAKTGQGRPQTAAW
jgi:hypothetical protein